MTALRSTSWLAEEDAILQQVYLQGGINAAMRALPHRSRAALFHRTTTLKLVRCRRWTVKDDNLLQNLWDGSSTLPEIAAALRRTQVGVYCRAMELRLPLGCPTGWEYLAQACERTGYGSRELRRILDAARVAIRPVIARPSARRGRLDRTWHGKHYVWPADVDAAIAEWLQAEPLGTAAARAGVGPTLLKNRLRAIGIKKRSARGRHFRVTAEQVARALGRERAA